MYLINQFQFIETKKSDFVSIDDYFDIPADGYLLLLSWLSCKLQMQDTISASPSSCLRLYNLEHIIECEVTDLRSPFN